MQKVDITITENDTGYVITGRLGDHTMVKDGLANVADVKKQSDSMKEMLTALNADEETEAAVETPAAPAAVEAPREPLA